MSQTTTGAPIATTRSGRVRGLERDGVLGFLGVPFGAPTGGVNRFRPPQAVAPWSGERDCSRFGPACPQPDNHGLVSAAIEALIASVLSLHDSYDEDCLSVNVWTPATDGGRRPVLVWFHGGAWTIGSGNLPASDGTRLARRGDVVVVAVNHRLGVLGHLAWPDPEAPASNAGALDMVAALEWVHDNIAAFGGDPDNVTIFGCSGGGAKVCTLVAMPAAEGLIHRAIVQSGPMVQAVRQEQARQLGGRLAELLGASSLDDLRQLPVALLVAAQVEVYGQVMASGSQGAGPVRDGGAVPADPFDPVAAPSMANVPLVIGTMRDEMRLFLAGDDGLPDLDEEAARATAAGAFEHGGELYDSYGVTRPDDEPVERLAGVLTGDWENRSRRIAERKLAGGRAPVWMYRFDLTTPVLDGRLGAPHGMDVCFVFDNLDRTGLHGDRAGIQSVADAMCDAWLAFAQTGDPNHAGLPTWLPFDTIDRTTMLFDLECSVAIDPNRAERLAWETWSQGR